MEDTIQSYYNNGWMSKTERDRMLKRMIRNPEFAQERLDYILSMNTPISTHVGMWWIYAFFVWVSTFQFMRYMNHQPDIILPAVSIYISRSLNTILHYFILASGIIMLLW